MSPGTRDTILALCTMLGFLAAVLGGLWRIWLRPFLQRELIEPAQELRKQVSENSHAAAERGEPPTLPDRIDDVLQAVKALGGKVEALDSKVDDHLISAAAVDAGQAARLTAVEQRLDRKGF